MRPIVTFSPIIKILEGHQGTDKIVTFSELHKNKKIHIIFQNLIFILLHNRIKNKLV